MLATVFTRKGASSFIQRKILEHKAAIKEILIRDTGSIVKLERDTICLEKCEYKHMNTKIDSIEKADNFRKLKDKVKEMEKRVDNKENEIKVLMK